MALSADSLDRLARHWADRFGCAPAAFRDPGVTVVGNADAETIRLFRRGDALVVAAPEDVREALAATRTELRDADPLAVDAVERALAGTETRVEAVHGPYFLGYVDAAGFSPIDSDARLLVAADEPAFERLCERVPDDGWARASPTLRLGRTAGLFEDGDLVAAATLSHAPFPDVGVAVAPKHRGRGDGRAVVSRITEAAFDADRATIPRYRTRESAPAAVALAESLGYERWARSAVLTTAQNGEP